MRKLLVTLITAMMILTFSIPAAVGAAETTTGSITINNATEDNTYKVFKMMDLLSYDKDGGVYSYRVLDGWQDFFKSGEPGVNYIEMDANGYVSWKAAEDNDTKAEFAKAALAYAIKKGIEADASSTDLELTEDGKYVFEGLGLGYYLIDSTMGSLCGLTTTDPNASINAKNGSPTIDKQVKEDSTNNWGDSNTAEIGQIVEFRTTITVHDGAQNYVLHDVMSEGLTFINNEKYPVKVTHTIPDVSTKDAELGKHYNVVTENLGDECAFHIVFTDEFCDHIGTNDKVIVYYYAELNEEAFIGKEENEDANFNETWLDYGENHYTTHDKTYTYTFSFDLVKTNSQNVLIDGASFTIHTIADKNSPIDLIKIDDKNYRYARPSEIENVETVQEIVVKDGMVTITGFDNGTYYLQEEKAPAGYNPLTGRQKFTIADSNLSAVFNGTGTDKIYSTNSGVQVVNKSGTMLPETGGFGTTMMLLFGGFVVLAAAVVLFVRKRMSQYAE